MPTLPSGKRIWLSMEAILAPDRMFYPCPKNHFWYREIDPSSGWLPLPGANSPEECWRLAQVPRNRLEAARYVRILVAEGPSDPGTWRGDWLLSFRRPDGFDQEDWEICLQFFGSEQTLEFLDMVTHRCQQQASASGHLDLEGFEPSLGGEVTSASRLARSAHVVDRLDALLETAEAMEDDEAASDIRERLADVQHFAEATLNRFGPHRGLAHRVAAASAASVGEIDEAVRHGRAATRLLAQDQDFGKTLVNRLRRNGHPEAAKVLSREILHGRLVNSDN